MAISDFLLLLLKGVLVALVPLLFVWTLRGQDRLRRLAWLAAFLAFDLVVFGGFTRLTDSGLGCPDWPGCFAQASPLSARAAIGAAHDAMPAGPVSMTKAWIEMIHRFLAMGLGLVIVVMALWSIAERRVRSRSPVLACALVLAVCVIGAFGALTVTLKLQPVIVTTHLLLALALLGLLTWHALRFERTESEFASREFDNKGLRALALAALVAVEVQVALGGWVSTNYAVLACNGFPLCQGQIVPAMDWRDGFALGRDLGQTLDHHSLPLEALVAINWVHRAFALVVVLSVGSLAAWCWRVPRLRRQHAR